VKNGLPVAEMDFEGLIGHEWLAANGIGGYASSTVASLNTRRYHGLLVAAMAPPVRRMVLLSRLEEAVRIDGREVYLACNEYPGTIWPRGHEFLRAFSCEPFPRWAYQGDGWTLLKQLRLLHGENTVVISYTLLGGDRPIDLELRPLLALRGVHELSYQSNGRLSADLRARNHWRVGPTSRTPEVFFAHEGTFDRRPNWYLNTIYRAEQQRGYAGLEDLWSPGAAYLQLQPGTSTHFACSSEPFDLNEIVARTRRQFDAGDPPFDKLRIALVPTAPLAAVAANAGSAAAVDAVAAALCRATGDFVLMLPRPGSTTEFRTPGRVSGDSAGCTVQYPWNAPSPRAALVGFSGLFLVPGRFDDARLLLLALVERLDNGLLPSEFPEDGSAPVYKGADVSLWFVNAVYQYLAYTGDEAMVRQFLLPAALRVIEAYRHGADLGIRIDADGLLVSGTPGIGTTWMDAKVGDWVVTPRSGCAVELNALWYNALCAAVEMSGRLGPCSDVDCTRLETLAMSVHDAFNRRFWNEAAGCCYDVVSESSGRDAGRPPGPRDETVRPNQLLAASLPFPILSPERHNAMLNRVRDELLTLMGVRSLSPRDPAYQGHFGGNVVSRDRAYHNGSAFPWLLGPFITASIRAAGETEASRAEARRILGPCFSRLQTNGLGQLCELFDGDAPHAPGGAIASPLSVAELLRCYAEDVLGRKPGQTHAVVPVNTVGAFTKVQKI
jgi:predicted glycogen debranching enzyme